MGEVNVPSAWLRGILDLCLLALVASGEAYGYELMRRLEDGGIGPVPGGSLYPALLRLEKQGLLAADWRAGEGGPGRKYYALTPEGRRQLDDEADAWRHFSGALQGLLTGVGAGTP